MQDVRICSSDMQLGSIDTDDQSSVIVDRKSTLDKITPPNSPNNKLQYITQSSKNVNW